MTAALELVGVSKSFREGPDVRPVLSHISLALEPGRLGMVTGVSGKGKSTLLSIAGGLAAPDEGRVIVNGTDVRTLDERGLDELHRCQVGFIFQTPYTVGALSARENIELARTAAGRAKDDASVEAVVRRLGLLDAMDLLPSQMSVGQRRRLSVARCMLTGQTLILADEPTNDLDTDGCMAVMGLLREHVDAGGAVLMVTHDPRWAELADDVFVLGEGGTIA